MRNAAAGYIDVAVVETEVSQTYDNFDAFWNAQTLPFLSPGRTVAKLDSAQRTRLRDLLCQTLPAADGTITYSATPVAGKGRKPH